VLQAKYGSFYADFNQGGWSPYFYVAVHAFENFASAVIEASMQDDQPGMYLATGIVFGFYMIVICIVRPYADSKGFWLIQCLNATSLYSLVLGYISDKLSENDSLSDTETVGLEVASGVTIALMLGFTCDAAWPLLERAILHWGHVCAPVWQKLRSRIEPNSHASAGFNCLATLPESKSESTDQVRFGPCLLVHVQTTESVDGDSLPQAATDGLSIEGVPSVTVLFEHLLSVLGGLVLESENRVSKLPERLINVAELVADIPEDLLGWSFSLIVSSTLENIAASSMAALLGRPLHGSIEKRSAMESFILPAKRVVPKFEPAGAAVEGSGDEAPEDFVAFAAHSTVVAVLNDLDGLEHRLRRLGAQLDRHLEQSRALSELANDLLERIYFGITAVVEAGQEATFECRWT
jgi:hypothetical protein